MTVPITVEYAVMVREEDEFVAGGQRLGDGYIPRPRGPAICLQSQMLHIAVCQGVLQRAGVIDHVHARERRGLITHAVEQSKQALQVPPGADVARNDQGARHEAAVYPRVRFHAGAENSEPSGSVAEMDAFP